MRRKVVTAILSLALIGTALSVIYVRHDARRGFVELQHVELTRDELEADWGRLQIEYATWADGSKVEQLAREQLALRDASSAQVMVIVE